MKNFKLGLPQKSETGLEIQRSDTSSDRVSNACAHKITLRINFISSSLQKESQAAIELPDDSNRCKRLLPTTVSSSDGSPQNGKDVNSRRKFHC